MFRYIALVWNASDGQQSGTAETLCRRLQESAMRWTQVFAARAVRVFCAGAENGALKPHVLPHDAGVVLGSVFERSRCEIDDAPSRRALFTPDSAQAILASQGRWLIANCWGNYVAFLRRPDANATHVLKDPSGSLPCWRTQHDGLCVVFSDIGDCLALGLRHFTINRTYLRARVVGFQDLEQSALNEADPVRRGECVELDPAARSFMRSRTFYWDPCTFSESTQLIEDSQQATRAMRATVRACTQTLAAGHDSVLHRLSGGLDSSVIAGCLADVAMRPRVLCYTYYNPNGRSDERPWARLAAEHAGFEHAECPISPADVSLQELTHMPAAPEPMPLLGYLLRSTLERSLAIERKASAVLTGDGGDSGFCSDSLPYVVADSLRRRGLTRATLRLAAQVALRTERSSWGVLLHAVRQSLFGLGMSDQLTVLRMSTRAVAAEARESFVIPQRYPHPWFRHLDHVPWATLRRLGMLVTNPEFYNVRDGAEPAPEIVSPLYAQPAVELFLRIPIYVHAEEGKDRGLARRAFEREVPAPILRRQWKDRAPGFHGELLHRNLAWARELLLDGVLVREGLLDGAVLEQALSLGPAKSDVTPVEIYRHLDVELWARHWAD